MAIYHLTAKIVSRKEGRSVVAAAAYRSGESLHDEHVSQTFDYTRKSGVEHTEILAPASAPPWVHNRETLWNTIERIERRKDAQLAREIEIALPAELTMDRQVELLRDFTQRTFVSSGMVADLALHRDNPENPHAHVLLTLRDLAPEGFGMKRREWNARAELRKWREQWAEIANEHLLSAGLDVRIDHRTLEAQGIDLLPGRKLGLSADRQRQPDLPPNLAERIAEQHEIAAENGRRILQNPNLALRALAHTQATFTSQDIEKYLRGRTYGAEQFNADYLKVTAASELALHAIPRTIADIDVLQQQAAERWQAKQRARELGLSSEPEAHPSLDDEHHPEHNENPVNRVNRVRHTHESPEDDLDL